MIITSRHYIIAAVLLLLGLQWLLHDDPEETTDVSKIETVKVIDWSLQKDVELEATEARKEQLWQLENSQTKRSESARELPDYRQRVLGAHQAEWTALLEQHWAEYEHLVKEAQQSKNGMTDCTICGGDTYLDFCIFCEEKSNGKCASCRGEGNRFGNDLCPTCQGDGNCFMCTDDLHQMMCPFCDDGDIDIDRPAPSPYPIER